MVGLRRFYNGSTVVLWRFHNGSTAALQQFYNGSTVFLRRFFTGAVLGCGLTGDPLASANLTVDNCCLPRGLAALRRCLLGRRKSAVWAGGCRCFDASAGKAFLSLDAVNRQRFCRRFLSCVVGKRSRRRQWRCFTICVCECVWNPPDEAERRET